MNALAGEVRGLCCLLEPKHQKEEAEMHDDDGDDIIMQGSWAQRLRQSVEKQAKKKKVEEKKVGGKVEEEKKEGLRRGRWMRRGAKGEREEVAALVTVYPAGVNTVGEQEGEWEELEIAVDSGATETVIPEDKLPGVELKEGEAYRRGVRYEVADGDLIPNLGEKVFVAETGEGIARRMKAQVAGVNKSLLSVKKVVQAGNRVVFDDAAGGGSYIEDKGTGERMSLEDRGGMYMLKLWVRQSF